MRAERRDDRPAPGNCGEHRPGRVGPRADRSGELVAAVTGRATAEAAAAAGARTADAGRRREAPGLWWYLLFAGMLLLAAETVISNRLSRKEKFL